MTNNRDNKDFFLSIDKKLIGTFPPVLFEGKITLIDNEDDVEEAVKWLEQFPIIGFDTETKPSFKKGKPNKMALMQLSTLENCFLFRLNTLGIPHGLRRIIENENILKVGLSVHDDFHVMHRSTDIIPRGFIELQDYVKKFRIADISLQKVFGIVFEQKISKNQRLTNWEAPTLSPAQQLYAATDAWACLKLYLHLRSGLFDPCACKYIAPLPCDQPIENETT